MRHRNKGRKLGRTASHRMALRRNLGAALLRRERVVTTPAKAKELRPFVERLITLARRAMQYKNTGRPQDRAKYLHYMRLAIQRLQDKEMVQKLFGEGRWYSEGSLAERYADRNGGYTRMVRLAGSRLGITVGDTVGAIPEMVYKIDGHEHAIRLTGNRLGDNAPQVLFELLPKEAPAEQEVAPVVTVSEQPKEEEQAAPAAVAEEPKDEAAEGQPG